MSEQLVSDSPRSAPVAPQYAATNRASALVALAACIGLLIYEATKSALFPRLTLWESHSVTIAFGTIVAALAARGALRAQARLHANVLHETAERLHIEAEQSSLRSSEARYRELVEQSPQAILVHRGGLILYLNPACLRLLGVRALEDAPDHGMLHYIHPDDHVMAQSRLAALERGDATREATEYRIRTVDGAEVVVEAASVLVTHDGRTAVQTVLRDVTERRRLEAQLYHQAFHDALTGLANRALFHDRVEHALAMAGRDAIGRHSAAVAVLFVDLDHFKHVNDAHGHAAGDALLVTVAARLQAATRGCDTVARLGGDEFSVLLEQMVSPVDAAVVAERIISGLRAPFVVEGRAIVVGASIGIASGADAEGVDALLRNADLALYGAKAQGRFRAVTYTPAMYAVALARVELESDLRPAVGRLVAGADQGVNEFFLMYQPIVDLTTEQTMGLEALARWQHPVRGLVPPSAFIPMAEETGLIVPLGRWVLREACRQAAQWEHAGTLHPNFAVSVNLSARQLQDPEIVADVAAALGDHGLAPRRLVLEITESVMMHDPRATLDRLRLLKGLGVRLAIDDFGTGYSSLSYLRQFPVDILKIDKSFIDGVGRGGDESVITTAIVSLGASLALRVVAEGIEDAAQLHRLRELGCERGQGYLFARPLAAADVLAAVAR